MAPPPPQDALTKARTALDARRFAQAEDLLRRHLQRSGGDAEALAMLGFCYAQQQFKERAVYYFQQALKARPLDPVLSQHLANAFRVMNKHAEAADVLLAASAASPQTPSLAANAAKALLDARRIAQARSAIDAALAAAPDDPDVLHADASFHHRVGDSDRARQTLARLVKLRPDDLDTRYSMASVLNYDHNATPRDQYVAHAAFGRALDLAARHEPFTHAPTDDPERRLRVGLISPDFRGHSVAFFAEPVLDHLDRERFWVNCYYTRDAIDATTERLRAKADAFVVTVRADEGQLARKIREDKVDVLVELCGLFAGHDLATMRLKPAPVQMTYIGYPNTTGVAAIDYRIVDSITDPPTDERYTVEKLLRLDPCFLCYNPAERFGAVPPAPATREGPFTFGSFNNAMKLSDATLTLWADVMRRAPGSRLLVKAGGMEEEPVQQSLRTRMTAAGIDLARVEIAGRTPDSLDHLRRYHEVDLALDTFPYNGTTTTCEALFMGVPVLSLSGRTHASRVGASLLSAAGLAEFATDNPERFKELAAAAAADRSRLTAARTGLRERLLGSALCDGPAFGRRLGELIRGAWRARCGGAGGNAGRGR